VGGDLLALSNQPQLASALTIVRLSLHVLGASVWVGGQLVLGGLLPTVRGLGDDAPRRIARAFGRLSWPAYWLLVVTGVWNYLAVEHRIATSSWSATFAVKMAAVVLAGLGTYLHTKAKTPRARGIYAAVGTTASIAALVLGVALAG
jgi:putative copper export protein